MAAGLGTQNLKNVLNTLLQSVRRRVKIAIREITGDENRAEAECVIAAFACEFGTEWPKAVAKITAGKKSYCSSLTNSRQ